MATEKKLTRACPVKQRVECYSYGLENAQKNGNNITACQI